MDSGSHDAGGDSWWSGQHHQQQQQQADGAAARLPAPLGPTSHPDQQQRRPNNKRGAAAASFAASRGSNGGNVNDDDDMMEEMESPEVRSFKRLKLEGGGYNHAGSSASMLSHGATQQYDQGQYSHAGPRDSGSGSLAAMNNHHSHAQRQQQMVRLNSYKNSTGGFMRESIY